MTLVEQGTVAGYSDAQWAAFAPLQRVATGYDAIGRKVSDALQSGSTTWSYRQYGYDALGRPECVALRMNPSLFGSTATPACSLGAAGSFGADRIARTVYDWASEVTQQLVAYGTADQAAERTLHYTPDGQVDLLTDARGNVTTYGYDGFDRPSTTLYPGGNCGSTPVLNCELLSYDEGSNVIQKRLRGGKVLAFAYDDIGRQTQMSGVDIVTRNSAYDLLGRQTALTYGTTGSPGLTWTYDALSRVTATTGTSFGTAMDYDLAGRRTKLTYVDPNPGGAAFFVAYDYLVTGEMTKVRENGATSGVGVLATYGYDDLGRRTSLARGNGRNTSYGYDGGSRLTALSQALSLGTTTATFAYDPAGGIRSRSTDTDILSSTAASNVSRTYSSNALNQYVQAGPIVLTHNANGNTNRLGPQTFTYDVLNQLIGAQGAIYTAVGGTTFDYDPAGRMDRMTSPNGVRRWGRDGDDVIVETDGSGDVLGRYVYGPGDDEPLVWYDGPSTAAGDRRFLAQDERGSVVAVMDGAGGTVAINRYDDWGIPAQGNLGRFQYTGQRWVPELQAYDYKARIYSPLIGRFLQADPIGYGAGMNLYRYVANDPINLIDPLGLDPKTTIEVGRKRLDGGGPASAPQSSGQDILVMARHGYHGIAIQSVLLFFGQANLTGNTPAVPSGQANDKSGDPKPCPPGPLPRPSTRMMNEATNKALASVPGRGSSSALTSEFSKVANLPNFNSGGWRSVGSSHSTNAYEHDLGDTGKAVKIYIGDSYFDGANTVTITDPTGSIGHYAAFPAFIIGMPVNARNAAVYLSQVGC